MSSPRPQRDRACRDTAYGELGKDCTSVRVTRLVPLSETVDYYCCYCYSFSVNKVFYPERNGWTVGEAWMNMLSLRGLCEAKEHMARGGRGPFRPPCRVLLLLWSAGALASKRRSIFSASAKFLKSRRCWQLIKELTNRLWENGASVVLRLGSHTWMEGLASFRLRDPLNAFFAQRGHTLQAQKELEEEADSETKSENWHGREAGSCSKEQRPHFVLRVAQLKWSLFIVSFFKYITCVLGCL